ncbi:ubiquitin carboxyl-terminal hydrolase 8-like isoform X2 [Xenia sp. Carnegie-2017]|uniref:ubiquitin carboxyl-terminal hydrolase 8-like isoform X2 n=1 Tax=Xenia sp. Carnegie-2017 TaxID=2897299 RepID=UPI001F041604|nr:ubiquitin carboxyl-terminal hydrolase 8-like isoform X2 [Xenia sp. Carnegie-2017]
MPSVNTKELHLATSIGELNKIAQIEDRISKNENPKPWINSADKVYKKAMEHEKMGDEENSFVLYMRFFNIIQEVRKTKKYQQDKGFYNSIIGRATFEIALEKAEKLSNSLEKRYMELEKANKNVVMEKDKKNFEEAKDKESDVLKDIDDLLYGKNVSSHTSADVDKKSNVNHSLNLPPNGNTSYDNGHITTIGPIALKKLLNSNQNNILILDTRTQMEFQSSRINFPCCINIPEDLLKLSVNVGSIERKLPKSTWNQWIERGKKEHIVILDQKSSYAVLKPESKVQCLKNALYHSDTSCKLQSEPVILDGGFEAWLWHYPSLVTNPTLPQVVSAEKEYNFNLDEISYPELPKIPSTTLPQLHMNGESKTTATSSKYNKNTSNSYTYIYSDLSNRTGQTPTSRTTVLSTPLEIRDVPSDIAKTSPHVLTNDKSNQNQALSNHTSQPSLLTNSTLHQPKTNVSVPQTEREVASSNSSSRSTGPSFNNPQNDRSTSVQFISSSSQHPSIQSSPSSSEKVRDISQFHVNTPSLPTPHVVSQLTSKTVPQTSPQSHSQAPTHNLTPVSSISVPDTIAQTSSIKPRSENVNISKQTNQPIANQVSEQINKTHSSEAVVISKPFIPSTIQPTNPNLSHGQHHKVPANPKEISKTHPTSQLNTSHSTHEPNRTHEMSKIQPGSHPNTSATSPRGQTRSTAIPSNTSHIPANQSMPQTFTGSRTGMTHGLPPGWERVLDRQTGRYYFRDHNSKTTHWNPPESLTHKMNQSIMGHNMQTENKDEPKKSSLKRSLSSPNLAKVDENETKGVSGNETERQQPIVNRRTKPLSEIQLTNLSPSYGGKGRALTGLRNLGNSCYMNSVLQCIFATAPLAKYILRSFYVDDINKTNPLGTGGRIAEELAVLTRVTHSGNYRYVSPYEFKRTIGKFAGEFSGTKQQDSQEFLLVLLDQFHEDTNRVLKKAYIEEKSNDGLPDSMAARLAWENHKKRNQSLIVELFQGQFKSTLTCSVCNTQSVTFDAFMSLTLPIPTNNSCQIEDCIRLFTTREKVSKDNKWFCPRCKQHREAWKTMGIWKLPPVLIVHFNRFKRDYDGSWLEKRQTNVHFPISCMDLSKFVLGPSKSSQYQLYGVSNHYGSMQSGHYTAYCRNMYDHKWYKYDDSDVTSITESSVKSSAAYILFYSSMNLPMKMTKD